VRCAAGRETAIMALRTAQVTILGGMLVAIACAGCTGIIGAEPAPGGDSDPGQNGAGSPSSPGSGPPSLSEPVDCSTPSVGTSPLLRVTRTQYAHAVRDLFDGQEISTTTLPEDEKLGTFYSNAAAPVAALDVEKYFDTAEAVASAAAGKLAQLTPCDRTALGDSACFETLSQAWGRRIFRRPLSAEELSDFEGIFAAHSGQGFDNGMRLVLTAMLASPHFLYRVELGGGTGGVTALLPLAGHELATRLAFFLWDSTPDEELLLAADNGQLASVDSLRTHAERLLTDARARDTVASFHRQWLGIDKLVSLQKDPDLFPSFDQELARSMQSDVDRFAWGVVFDGDGRLATLLSSAPAGMDPSQRAGLLTQPAFLAAHAHQDQTSPVARGLLIRTSLLCDPPPPPPPEVNASPPEPDPDSSTRERFLEHTESPSCAGCHTLLDPIGFTFEHYDAVGAYRTSDGGEPVDATGEISGTRDADGSYDGAIELAARLASSEQVRECVTRHWFEYALGRAPAEADTCSLVRGYDAFASADFDVRQLMVAIAVSDAFRLRKGP
jgi:hypothetical protein